MIICRTIVALPDAAGFRWVSVDAGSLRTAIIVWGAASSTHPPAPLPAGRGRLLGRLPGLLGLLLTDPGRLLDRLNDGGVCYNI